MRKSNLETEELIFKIPEGVKEIVISDPCYTRSDDTIELTVGKDYILICLEYKYGELVGLIIRGLLNSCPISKNIEVDSGLIGIFSKDYYDKYHSDDSSTDTWYEENIVKNIPEDYDGSTVFLESPDMIIIDSGGDVSLRPCGTTTSSISFESDMVYYDDEDEDTDYDY